MIAPAATTGMLTTPPPLLDDLDRAVREQGGRVKGREVLFHCPFPGHEDRHPSARWNREKGGFYCDVCKDGGGAIDLARLLNVQLPERSRQPLTFPEAPQGVVATYDYRDADGVVRYQVLRLGPKKSFRQRRPDGEGGWIWDMQGVESLLYHLPQLLASDDIVTVVEGEEDVHSLEALGFTATCNSGGAGKWRDEHAWSLWGRDVVILPDNDSVGRKHAASVARSLDGIAARVRVVALPGLAEKADVSDWIGAGGTAEQLRRLIDDAPDWESGEPLDLEGEPSKVVGVPFLQIRRASQIEAREINWLWEQWLPAAMVALLAGYGGNGKSTIALHIAAAGSAGGTLPDGQPAPTFNTLILAAEDSPEHTIIPRLMAMGADLERINILDGVVNADGEPGWVQLRNHAPAIEQAILAHDIGLVIIDPVSSYIGDANGDKESDVRAGLTPLVKVAERTGAAVLMIRHLSKAGDGTRAASRILGSTAWHDIPRVAWMLADAPDDHQPAQREDGTRDTRRVLGVVKSNLTAKPQARWCLQPVDGPLSWLPDPSPVAVDECFYAQGERAGKARQAEEWLAEHLAGGSKPARSVEAAAKDAGISPASLKRARAALNVTSRKEGIGQWVLGLPPRLASKAIEDSAILPDQETAPTPASKMSAFNGPNVLNALHNDLEAKAFIVNALNPFPENQGNRGVASSLNPPPEGVEEPKAFNASLMGDLNAFHNDPPFSASDTSTPDFGAMPDLATGDDSDEDRLEWWQEADSFAREAI